MTSETDFFDIRQAGFSDITVDSRVSYGLEEIDALDEASREILTDGVDWQTVPDDAALVSIRVSARKIGRLLRNSAKVTRLPASAQKG